jgi:hypothetical protein
VIEESGLGLVSAQYSADLQFTYYSTYVCVRVKCQYIHTVDLQFTYSACMCVSV